MQNSPFPGMDPYLEEIWPEVHARVIVYAANQLNRQLPVDLQANIEQSVSLQMEEERMMTRPDVHVDDQSEIPTAEATPHNVAVAEPALVKRAPYTERHIEIIESGGGRVVTVIEFLSPWNKIGQRGRNQYRLKQMAYLDAKINLVEIDLVRRGNYILAAPLEEPDYQYLRDTPYVICVFRRTVPDMFEVYRLPLQDPLPNISIPLRDEERDIVLQIQPLLDDSYRDGRYYRLDYESALNPPLEGELANWVDQRLKDMGRRS